jgi:pimeloyl-ACP methyl ester carboxylesterase
VWSVQLYTRSTGTGVPVVLLHAFPLSSAMWLAQREGLAGGCRVITPDLRGFGGSLLGDDEPSIDLMADDVARVLDAQSVDQAVIGGLSMGGYVTMAFARRHPDRMLGLVLADTKATPDSAPVKDKREDIAGRVLADGTAVLVAEVLPALTGRTTRQSRPMVHGRVRGLVQAAPTAAVAWAQRAMAARQDSFETLAALKVPLLVVVGEEDEISSVADAEAMVQAAPDARLEVIERAGHLTAVEQPEAFNAAVAAFVRSVPGGAAPTRG